jgi:hypothetical protein
METSFSAASETYMVSDTAITGVVERVPAATHQDKAIVQGNVLSRQALFSSFRNATKTGAHSGDFPESVAATGTTSEISSARPQWPEDESAKVTSVDGFQRRIVVVK